MGGRAGADRHLDFLQFPPRRAGVTSTITFDGTINPDFRQVESDQFQVEFNERLPVFFSEKRPFFMEGLGLLLNDRVTSHGDMTQAAYAYPTRRVLVAGQIEHLGDDFRLDTAFFNQPAIPRVWQYVEPMFSPDISGAGRLKRAAP